MNGKELILHICAELEKDGQFMHDGDIVKFLRNVSKRDLKYWIATGKTNDTNDWSN